MWAHSPVFDKIKFQIKKEDGTWLEQSTAISGSVTREQNEDRPGGWLLAALPVPEENIYMDKQSGKGL